MGHAVRIVFLKFDMKIQDPPFPILDPQVGWRQVGGGDGEKGIETVTLRGVGKRIMEGSEIGALYWERMGQKTRPRKNMM